MSDSESVMSDSDSFVSDVSSVSSTDITRNFYAFDSALVDLCIAYGIRYESNGLDNGIETTCRWEPVMKTRCDPDEKEDYWSISSRLHDDIRVFIKWTPANYEEETHCVVEVGVCGCYNYRYMLDGIFPEGSCSVKFTSYDGIEQYALEFIRKIIARMALQRNLVAFIAASKIQNAWRRAIGCPDYKLCQRRVKVREFDELMSHTREWMVAKLDSRP